MKIIEENRNKIRSDVVNVLMNFFRKKEPREFDEIRKNMRITSRFLKEHDELIVARSDKGGSTVVMYREEYVTGMNDMLKDDRTYKKIVKDPTNKFQLQSNFAEKNLARVKELLKNNNYPVCFINKAAELFSKKVEAKNNIAGVSNIKKCYKFPFIKGLS
ncbi:Protein of unknown function [Cotesia congregata]|uniref:Uncharacterized protein n=1 Tax=Cotesia congregata TaxID=51543 RepID=A0A8J2HIZ9_COTCN|nr:Protein of unknown function [Cotesia congregata]